MKSICKLQRALASSDQQERYFCYNEDRSIEHIFDTSDEVEQLRPLFGEGVYKLYFHTVIDKNGVLHIDDEAPWQDW